MQNKKQIAVGVIVVILLATGGVFSYLYKTKAPLVKNTQNQADTQRVPEKGSAEPLHTNVQNSSPQPVSSIECPKEYKGHVFTHAGVYDGPAAEMADLVPTDSVWDLTDPAVSPKGYFLGCTYKDSSEKYEMAIPKDFTSCKGRNDTGITCVSEGVSVQGKALSKEESILGTWVPVEKLAGSDSVEDTFSIENGKHVYKTVIDGKTSMGTWSLDENDMLSVEYKSSVPQSEGVESPTVAFTLRFDTKTNELTYYDEGSESKWKKIK